MINQFENYFASIRELNALAISTLEQLVDIQLRYIEAGAMAGVEQLKTAAAINGPVLQNYMDSQVATFLTDRAIDDTRAVAEPSTNYDTEVRKNIKQVSNAFKTSKRMASKPKGSEPKASGPETSKRKAGKQKTSKPRTSKRKATKLKASEPKASKRKVSKRKASKPKASKRKVSRYA